MKLYNTLALASLATISPALAHSGKDTLNSGNKWYGARPDGHAPISVMAEHTHSAGEWMASYRYMNMQMNGLYMGDSKINPNSTNYNMVPEDMEMQMHMVGVMYAPTDELTLMAMTNYIENSMTMLATKGMMAGRKSTMKSSGWGDTSIGGLYKFHDANRARAHVGLNLSLPTGSTSQSFTMMGNQRHQPFGMQLGSGTFDLLPSITYLHQPSDNWSWGAQANARLHLGTNDQGYSLGDSIGAQSWIARNVCEWASLSLRLGAKSWSRIDGDTDNSVNQGMMSTMSSAADPNNYGGTRIDIGAGLNLWHPGNGFRVATELTTPLYQQLDGPQLGNDWTLTLGTQYAW
ncbi:transporter [Rubritalea marina]|uniref:transporter n=1 Tax=Rubritalea marina TaxID=361055 RepID=UPI000365252B|nr:transporter [Rubritalea marina]